MRKISDIHGRLRIGYELLNISQRDVFLNVGCAWGYLEKKLIDTGMKYIYAIDVNKEGIKKANKDARGAHFVLGSATNLPFKDEVFDKLSLFDVIEHLQVGKDATAISEANRVLKKEGILVVSVPNKGFLNICQYTDIEYLSYGHRHYTQEELILLLKKSNFDVVSIFIGGEMTFKILMQYVRLFFSFLNRFFQSTKTYNKIDLILDNFEDWLYKNGNKNGYTLIIKAKKSIVLNDKNSWKSDKK